MTKLSAKDKFLDFSDYGRPLGNLLAKILQNTRATPVHVTIAFGICGVLACVCILNGFLFFAAFLIILKSIIDAADGALSRLKNKPSYFGRYLDSVFDIILNFLFLASICYVTQASIIATIVAFIGIQLQGTLYNYYYVIVRNRLVGGDATSKIFEYKAPTALIGETQREVNFMYKCFTILYCFFDKTIHFLDDDAYKVKTFPAWFMSLVSLLGLGFQLLIIAVLLLLNLMPFIIPFFIGYNMLLVIIIIVRKYFFPVNAIIYT